MTKCDVCERFSKKLRTSVFGIDMCYDCWDDYMETEESWAESFADFAEIPEEDYVDDIEDMVNVWLDIKKANKLDLPKDKIKDTENRFVKNAAGYGVMVDLAAGTVEALN